MRILIFFIVIFLYADINTTLNKISKNSLDYSYAKILVSKINNLKPKKFECDCKVLNQFDLVNKFLKLVKYEQLIKEKEQQIKDLNVKINIISSDAPLNELQQKFFIKKKEILQKEKEFLSKHLKYWENNLFENSKKINFNPEVAKNNIEHLIKKLKILKKENEKFKILYQKWELLDNESKLKYIKSLINSNLKKQHDILKDIIKNNLIIWFYNLKQKSKETFKITKDILNYASFDKDFKDSLYGIMIDFEKKVFGSKLLLYSSKDEVNLYLKKIEEYLHYPIFKTKNTTITPIDFIIFIFVVVIGFFIGKYYKKLIYSLRKKYDIGYSTATLLANMGYYFILTLSFLIGLKTIGLDLSSLAIIAGALSVGIGFGLQNVVSNFVSGIIMMFERSIKVGDYIQIDENIRGEVIDISMRSTVIKTNDNINLIIPNQTFIKNQIINWTMNDDIVRFRIPFGVAYGSDIEKLEKILLEELNKSNLPFVRSKDENLAPRVVFKEMGDSSLNFELFVWVKGKFARMPRRTNSKFLKFIYITLSKYGFEIPFPQQDIHFKNALNINIRKNNEK